MCDQNVAFTICQKKKISPVTVRSCTFLVIVQSFLLKVLEDVWSEPLLQTVTVKAEEAFQSVPAERDTQLRLK